MRRLRWLSNPGYNHLKEMLCHSKMMLYRDPIVYRDTDYGRRPVDIDLLNEEFMHQLVTEAGGDAWLIWESLGEWILEESEDSNE